jgi:hypothetical protein
MSLTAAKMTGSLKDQLLEEEKALKAELEAVQKDVKKEAKKVKKEKKDA